MRLTLLPPTTRTPGFRSAPEQMRIFCVSLILFLSFFSGAQNRCGSVFPEPEDFENWIHSKITEARIQRAFAENKAVVYEIPVVVHVMEPASGGSLNITDAAILRQIEILNEDFRRTNADASNTPAVFLPVAADVEVQFVLARQDPAGNPSNGIVRVRGTRDKYSATAHQRLLRSESYWPAEHYLNIHVLDLFSFLGYASFPVSDLPGINNGSSEYIWDGVLIDYLYFGENPTAPEFASFGRTATHEIGHYLGLRHIWGDGSCSIDDFVDDTPLADDDNGGLSSPCTFPSDDNNVCETDEMFQNYMDYTDDTCMNIFTEGQKTRIRTVLENSPRRISLLTSPGLSEPLRVSNDLAITKLLSPQQTECGNVITPSVQVTNFGDNAITSYDIILSNNSTVLQTVNQNSTLNVNESEIVLFNDELIDTVPEDLTFTVSNVNGTTDGNPSNSLTTVPLISTSSQSLPFSVNFEGTVDLQGQTGITHPWEIAIAPKESPSNNALQFKGFENTSAFGEATVIKTPVFNLSGINSAELAFSYAYAHVPGQFQDGFTLKYSTDCGLSFSDEFLFNSYGSELATTSSTSAPFVPADLTDWRDTIISITHIIQAGDASEVQFAFAGQNGGTNNLFLDDITILQTNINATDVGITNIDAPLTTCHNATGTSFTVRNVGYEQITELTYQYTISGNTVTETLDNLTLVSGEFRKINLAIPVNNGVNAVEFTITEVNGIADQNPSDNDTIVSLIKNDFEDTYPLLVDFEMSDFWQTASSNESQIWQRASVGSNGILLADAFSQTVTGTQSWFISPSLNTGMLDSAGLSFRASYASRTGFEDRLRVLMSIDCGESYGFELLDADSDSLAVVESSGSWIPASEADWKEFKLDLKSSIPWKDEIRIAFVFTNGNGNNLYIDDINIGIKPTKSNVGIFTVFPNPAHRKFNVAFDLNERDDVQIRIIDISGKVVFTRQLKNVLNQVYDFDAISQDGFYFVKITGRTISKTERLYIRR
ncbi:MAG: choice-of-anchor J domain-containing protein [Cyclobacteriaceae bacterium]